MHTSGNHRKPQETTNPIHYGIYDSTEVVGSPFHSRLSWVPLQATNALFDMLLVHAAYV